MRAVGIQEKSLGTDHPELATSLINRAQVLYAQVRVQSSSLYGDAFVALQDFADYQMQREACGVVRWTGGALPLLHDPTAVLVQEGRAGPLYVERLDSRTSMPARSHPPHHCPLRRPDSQGKYGEADVVCLRAIGIREKALGPDHPELVDSLTTRAHVLHAQVIRLPLRRRLKACGRLCHFPHPA